MTLTIHLQQNKTSALRMMVLVALPEMTATVHAPVMTVSTPTQWTRIACRARVTCSLRLKPVTIGAAGMVAGVTVAGVTAAGVTMAGATDGMVTAVAGVTVAAGMDTAEELGATVTLADDWLISENTSSEMDLSFYKLIDLSF